MKGSIILVVLLLLQICTVTYCAGGVSAEERRKIQQRVRERILGEAKKGSGGGAAKAKDDDEDLTPAQERRRARRRAAAGDDDEDEKKPTAKGKKGSKSSLKLPPAPKPFAPTLDVNLVIRVEGDATATATSPAAPSAKNSTFGSNPTQFLQSSTAVAADKTLIKNRTISYGEGEGKEAEVPVLAWQGGLRIEPSFEYKDFFCQNLILFNPPDLPTARSFLVRLTYKHELPYTVTTWSPANFFFKDGKVGSVTVLPNESTKLKLKSGEEAYSLQFCGQLKKGYNYSTDGFVFSTTQLGKKCQFGKACTSKERERYIERYGEKNVKEGRVLGTSNSTSITSDQGLQIEGINDLLIASNPGLSDINSTTATDFSAQIWDGVLQFDRFKKEDKKFCASFILVNPVGFPAAESFRLQLAYERELPYKVTRTEGATWNTWFHKNGTEILVLKSPGPATFSILPGTSKAGIRLCGKFKSKTNTIVKRLRWESSSFELGSACAFKQCTKEQFEAREAARKAAEMKTLEVKKAAPAVSVSAEAV